MHLNFRTTFLKSSKKTQLISFLAKKHTTHVSRWFDFYNDIADLLFGLRFNESVVELLQKKFNEIESKFLR